MKKGKEKHLRVYFTGVGGQGTLTATNLLARAALLEGLTVVAGEVHGMAQRGGVVESVMLLGGWRSPKLDYGEADVMLGFEPLETLRGLPYLRAGGAVFASLDKLPPLSASLGQAQYPDMKHIESSIRAVAGQCHFFPCRQAGIRAGSIQSGNTVLLAAFCASNLSPISLDTLGTAIRKFLPARMQEANLKALEEGRNLLRKALAG